MPTTTTIDPHAERITFTEAAPQPEQGLHRHENGTISIDGLPPIDVEHRDRIIDHVTPLFDDIAAGDTGEALSLINRAAYEPSPVVLSHRERVEAAKAMRRAVAAFVRGDADTDELVADIETAAGALSHGVSDPEELASIAGGRAPYSRCGSFLGKPGSAHPPMCPECDAVEVEEDRQREAFDAIMGGSK